MPFGGRLETIGIRQTNLALAAGAGKIGFLFETPLDEKDEEHGVWYTQSADGASWSKPATLHVIEAGNDKAYVLWQEPGDNKYREGMLLWHER